MLFPLPEPSLLRLNLLSELLPERLLLLLELGVIELLDLGFAELARLHLLLPVVLIVQLLRRRDQVEHVRANEQRSQLLEVAVVLVLDFRHTPDVLTTLDGAAIGGAHVLGRADDGEGDRINEHLSVLCVLIIVHRRCVDSDPLSVNNLANLSKSHDFQLVSSHTQIFTSRATYTLLEVEQVVLGEGVGLCDDGNEIDARPKALHDLDIERLETKEMTR